ncbi:MAG: hypothetical protein AB1349_01540 [Elusimicrobiota bacterium]
MTINTETQEELNNEVYKLDKDADLSKKSKEALWYDDAILHYRYHKAKQGLKYQGWSLEDFVNLHVLILQELKKRKLPHFDRDDELDMDTKPFLKQYAPIEPSGEKLGERIYLKDILPYFKTFLIRKPYIWLVGGLVVNGSTEGDIDLLVNDSPDIRPEFKHILEWRIMRSFPKEYWSRFQFHYNQFWGPFTDHLPLYNLTFERCPDTEIIRMSADSQKEDIEQFILKDFTKEELLELIYWTENKLKSLEEKK